MKPDEVAFLIALARERPRQGPCGRFATDVAEEMGMHCNRACYLLGKWTRKGWWEYGVSLRGGWLTEAGLVVAAARTMVARLTQS